MLGEGSPLTWELLAVLAGLCQRTQGPGIAAQAAARSFSKKCVWVALAGPPPRKSCQAAAGSFSKKWVWLALGEPPAKKSCQAEAGEVGVGLSCQSRAAETPVGSLSGRSRQRIEAGRRSRSGEADILKSLRPPLSFPAAMRMKVIRSSRNYASESECYILRSP